GGKDPLVHHAHVGIVDPTGRARVGWRYIRHVQAPYVGTRRVAGTPGRVLHSVPAQVPGHFVLKPRPVTAANAINETPLERGSYMQPVANRRAKRDFRLPVLAIAKLSNTRLGVYRHAGKIAVKNKVGYPRHRAR